MEDLEVERIKEEPVWESCVSEHALLEDLYADHKVKHELVLGPELLQGVQKPDPHTIEVTVKIEETCEEIENGQTYEEELLKCSKKPDIGIIVPLSTNNYLPSKGEDNDKHYYLSQKDLLTLQNCFVRIERMTFHKEKHTCKTCGKSYSQRSSLTCHMRIHARKRATAKKEISNATTKNTVKETSNHVNIKKKAVKKPHECGVCGKLFKLKALLTNHERTHTGEKPYSCTICDRRFTELSNLRRHERTHTGEKPFSCKICKRHFSLKCNLMDHIRIHTKERPYSCDLCLKQFPDHSSLNRHKLSHTGYKKFKCDICKNQFARKYYLIDHLRTHTKKKPYSCEICSKPFENEWSLRAHKKHHKKHYMCEICDEQFSKIVALKRHLLTHLG